jgi:hypothetical protein
MFSVILHGRNASHGYNLHKRAAIGLNALAEVMSDPDDEILFVDDNTPDDHPTFPEAIHDTLTNKAKSVMRILRVRPQHRLDVRGLLDHAALESQSRNVALRRSNPRNRWCVFPTADTLLVPRDDSRSLSGILGELTDGFYRTPRFDLPKTLWEAAFDRGDPEGNLAKLRHWPTRFHLDRPREEAGTEFQVMLRDDLFAIHGFDETISSDGSSESNLAARLALHRGPAGTLTDKVLGYRCDPGRTGAANGKGQPSGMKERDHAVGTVTTPHLPAQAGSWGWPDLDIEEIRLDRGTSYERFFAGVGAAIESAKAPYDATSLESHLYHDLTYSVAHTLPFVCDQVLTYPKHSSLMFVGARADFLRRFSKAWRGMGFTGPILVPRECAGLPIDGPCVETGPFAELLPRAEMFIFEFGLATQRDDEPVRTGRKITPADDAFLKVVKGLFRRAAALEAETRPQGRGTPRRFIGVNVIYNYYWPLFTDHIGANITPFCSQVLAGDPRATAAKKGRFLRLRRR